MEFPFAIDLVGLPAWVVTTFLGLIFGSFASAMTYRIPRNVSWVSARSACPSCGHLLFVPDLVPFFSWAFLGGRCRHCRAAIGWRYPVIELVTLILCLSVCALYGFHWAALILMIAMPFLVALVAIDLEFMILPDQLNIIVGVLGLIYVVLTSDYTLAPALGQSLGAGLFFAGLVFIIGWMMSKLLKKDALGFGDVKFFAVAGIWLGIAFLPVFLVLSGMIGLAMGIFWKYVLKQDRFPFGPALIASFTVCILFFEQIQLFLTQSL